MSERSSGAGQGGTSGAAEASGDPHERRRRYADCRTQLESLLEGEPDAIARMASTAALLFQMLPAASFVGFYRALGDHTLVIGPYQGPPACLRIPFGRGVCGLAASQNRSLLVPDVHAFPTHIACDALALSELVVPVRDAQGRLLAVLDLDSRRPAAFDAIDQEELEAMLQLLFQKARGGA